jgi:hypothetical protein
MALRELGGNFDYGDVCLWPFPRTSGNVRLESAECTKADVEQVAVPICNVMSTRPSVMGPMRSSLPCDRHAAELTLLSVVDAKAATLCLLEGAVSLSSTRVRHVTITGRVTALPHPPSRRRDFGQ